MIFIHRIRPLQVIFAVLILLVFPGKPFVDSVAAQANEKPPFLYYYSPDRAAFLIERADGSDSHPLISYTLPSDEILKGPGWSPSGQWFAWCAGMNGGTGAGDGYIVSRDGKKLIPLADTLHQITDLKWSPKNDLLMVEYLIEQGSAQEVIVLDVAQNKVILKLDETDLGVAFWGTDWTPDGHYIVVWYAQNGFGMKVISLSGKSEDRSLYVNEPCYFWPNWSPNDTVAYADPTNPTLIVENFASQAVFRVKAPNIVAFTDWNPSSAYAFIYTKNDCSDSDYQLWLLSVPDKTIRHLADNVLAYNQEPYFPSSTWSLKGDEGVYRTEIGTLYMVHTSPFQVNAISDPSDSTYFAALIHWNEPENKIVFAGIDDQRGGTGIYSYSPLTHSVQVIVPHSSQPLSIKHMSFSADERFIAYTSYGQGYVVDTVLDKRTEIRLPEGTDPDWGIDETVWHPSQPWLFLISNDVYPYLRFVGVSSAAGNDSRLLAACTALPSCFGWLPDLTSTF